MNPWLGIDPGVNGAICLISNNEIRIWKMPEDLAGIYELLFHLNIKNCRVLCESQHGRPAYSKRLTNSGETVIEPIRGATAIWTFAEHYGSMKAILYALGANMHKAAESLEAWERESLIAPRTWMKAIGIPPREKGMSQSQWKGALWEKAKSLYPDAKILKQCADAVLIAHVCKVINQGKHENLPLDFGDL